MPFSSNLPPLGLYIHIPWCLKKCPYCDFNSHALRQEEIPEDRYVNALLDDLTQELPDFWGRSINSIFIGGGTPSLLSPTAMDKLLSGIRALTNPHPEIEVTIEANPGTFEQEKFGELRSLGINRLSIGIQSFDDAALSKLGRIHNGHEAENSVEIARKAGFENINLDLMFGLPGQTQENALSDLQKAISLQANHISWYQLTIEPNTPFYQKPPQLPDHDMLWNMQMRGTRMLEHCSYFQYEISAFADSDAQCQHNLNYWRFGDYLGVGAGAHGKISFAGNGKILRRQKRPHPKDYLQYAATGNRILTQKEVSPADTPLEFMMNALRLKNGVESSLFPLHTGLPLQLLQQYLHNARERGLMEDDPLQLVTTEFGYSHLNDVLELFMDNNSARPMIPIKAASATDTD